jgi:DNA-binding GntR family transcriptional regulator
MQTTNTSSEQAQSMQDKAYLHVLSKLLSGELRAGTPISEVSLARELGTSRTPLREALRRLVAEGFIRQIPNRGSIVAEFSKRDVAELYELREALEVFAVGQAAEHTLRSADLEALRQLVKEITVLRDELIHSGAAELTVVQLKRFVQADMNFHATLVRAAANRRILKVFADTRLLLNIFAMRRRGHTVAVLDDVLRYHSQVLEAVQRGDPDSARRLLSEHIQVSKQERLHEYDEWERETAINHTSGGFSGVTP